MKNKTIVYGLLAGLFCFVLIQTQSAFAAIPELKFILKKSSQTTGKKIIQIEQEVTFNNGTEEAKVDETWLVEGDKNLKMNAVGKNLYKDNIKLNYLYNGKNKTFLIGKNKNTTKLTTDFYQRYLFIRSKDSFFEYLKDMNIPSETRLSRASGVITFLIGKPSEQILNPQVWIGQEDFAVRKIRTPSAAEITLDQISALANDTFVAKSQSITWQTATGQKLVVQIKIKKIDINATGNITSFYPQNIESPSEISFLNKTPLTAEIEEFYSRFR